METPQIHSIHPTADAGAEITLVQRALGGDTSAFEQLVLRYTGLVFAIAYARVGDRDAAEDLVQEAFLRAYAGLKSLKEPRYFTTWLSRIARNLATDWQRRGQRRSRAVALVSTEEIPDMHDPTQSNVRDKLADAQQWTMLDSALRRLNADQREILLLHYAEDWTLTEISEKLHVHRTTVSRHMELALETLRADVAPILRDSCRAARSGNRLPGKAAAAVAAFAVLPAMSRAAVVAELTTKAGVSSVAASAAGTGATTGASILTLTGAAAAAGGKVVMTKTAIAGVCVFAGVIAAGIYAKEKVGYQFASQSGSGGRPGISMPAEFKKTYPPGTVIVKASSLLSATMGSTGMGEFKFVGLDLGNALTNAFEDYQRGTIVYNTTLSDRKDVIITAPAGHPEQLRDILKVEIPKAYGVTAEPQEREMDVYVLTAPEGATKLQPPTGDQGATGGPKEMKFGSSNMDGIARMIAANLNMPVLNESNLAGEFSARVSGDLRDKAGLVKAVREQLGLELRAERRVVKVLVVDKAA